MTQYGKFMGSTVSPDGRFLAATQRRQVGGPADLRPADLQADLDRVGTGGRRSTRSSPTAPSARRARRTRPTASSSGCPQQDGLTRFPVNADGTLGTPTTLPAPAGRRPLRPARQVGLLARRVDALRRGQRPEHRRGARPRDRHGQADLERRHRPACSSTFVGGKLYVSNEGGRQAQPGETTINSYGTQVPADPLPRHLDDRHRQRHRHRGPVGGGQVDRRRPAPDRAVRRRTTRCSSPTPTATPSRSSTPARTRSSRPSRPSRGRRPRSATSPPASR